MLMGELGRRGGPGDLLLACPQSLFDPEAMCMTWESSPDLGRSILQGVFLWEVMLGLLQRLPGPRQVLSQQWATDF